MTILQIFAMFVMVVAIFGSIFQFIEYHAKEIRYGNVYISWGWWLWQILTPVSVVAFVVSLTGIK